ncbi:pyridoxal phosphate-dependent aminotransferase [Ligilactobacillus sp. Marseille-Q7487]|jgi:aspartate/methionine/tyrosine aminotransferase|uniref:pyridoxal phosphate-dependent aminotransferase n=1 Tax=Ligilactobacillus sp. Marseille-Q7487 TaxID=3022128 RepID=UPI0015B441E4|nr:pyridoxal phosphate-dependent aminotransferase [Ligilactobacillus sp. Marseille-Q7487]
MKMSQRIENIQSSATLALSTKANELKQAGVDIINLSVGEPDFPTPQHIKDAAIQAINNNQSDRYTPALGITELRQAIANELNQQYQTAFTAKNVAVTVGGKFSLYAVTQALVNAGDEVLIPLPYWVSYEEQVKLAGGKPVFVAAAPDSLKVTVEQLEAARTNKTIAVIINSPQNPSGLIYSEDELIAIGNWAVKNDIILIADDMYGKLVYNGNRFVSLLDLSDEIKQQTILVSGFSKTYAMTGWRVGYTVANTEFIARLGAFVGHATSNLAAVSQYAALAAVTGSQDCVEQMKEQYEKRLNTVFDLLTTIPGVSLLEKPQGAFYLFPNVKQAVAMTGYASTEEFANALLTTAHVAVVPGSAFGMPDHIRLSYATDLASLKEAISRIKKFIEDRI